MGLGQPETSRGGEALVQTGSNGGIMKSGIRNFVYWLGACLCVVSGGMLEADGGVAITSGTPPNGAVNTPYAPFFITATGPNCSSEPTFDYSVTGLPSGGLA